jgi:calcium/calmodulin-dependent protein kinase (CaM kinase) II
LSPSQRDQDILSLNQALLESVVRGDWSTYSSLCSQDLTCFEAETNGILAEGLPFHQFYFDLPNGEPSSNPVAPNVTMAGTHLRWLGEDAVVLSYTRLTQRWQGGEAITASCCETRVWQKHSGQWHQVHVHRS